MDKGEAGSGLFWISIINGLSECMTGERVRVRGLIYPWSIGVHSRWVSGDVVESPRVRVSVIDLPFSIVAGGLSAWRDHGKEGGTMGWKVRAGLAPRDIVPMGQRNQWRRRENL